MSEKNKLFSLSQVNYLLMAAGIILRFKIFFEQRSIWADEAVVAVQTANKTLEEIFYFLFIFSEQPIPPLGFLLSTKMFIVALGNNEFSLHLYSLMMGVLSIVLFYHLLKNYVSDKAVVIAMGIFCLSEPLIYYSSEAKHYSGDVFFFIFLFLMFGHFSQKDFDRKSAWILGFGGAVIIWFSYTALIALAAFGIIMFGGYLLRKKWRSCAFLIMSALIWLWSFIFLYKLSFQKMWANAYTVHTYANIGGYSNHSVWTWQGITWLSERILDAFASPCGLAFPYAMLCVYIIGCVYIYKKNKKLCITMVLPLIIVIVMAAFHKYPFYKRTILFLAPVIIIPLAEGVLYLTSKTRKIVSAMLMVLPYRSDICNIAKRGVI